MKKTQFSQFWNLRDSPFFGRFEITEDILLSAQRALVTRVLIAAQQGAPIIGVFAEHGAGSTVVARWLYQNIPETTHYALILTPGSHDVGPSRMTERIKAFASARIPGVGGGAEQPAKVQDGSIRGQMAELLPVFDALRASGKKIALIVDNAALLAGEPWAAFLLGILRQGELIEHVLQFVLIGHTSDMSQMMQTWPRVLEARVSRFALSRPSPDDLGTWLCNRLVLAGADRLIAEQVFTSAARKRLLDLTSCSLPKLSWLAEGAMVEAFMTGSHVVDVVHVDRSHSGGSELVTSDGVRGQMVVGAGASVRRQESHIDAQWGREQTNQEPGKTGEPSLLDLIKPE